MQIAYLLNILPKGFVSSWHLEKPAADIAEISEIIPWENEPDVLYVSRGGDYLSCPYNMISPAGNAPNQIITSPGCDLDILIKTIRELLIEDRRDAVRGRLITQAFLKGRGLTAFIEMAAQILENPLFVLDNSYTFLARSLPAPTDNPALEKIMHSDTASEESILLVKSSSKAEPADPQVPLRQFNRAAGCEMLSIPIMVHSIEVGQLIMLGACIPIRDGDSKYFGLIADLVSQELQKSEFFQSSASTGGYFLSELLEEEKIPEELISRRLSYLSFQPKDEFFTVIFDNENHDLKKSGIQALDWKLQALFPSSPRTPFGGRLVMLLTQDHTGIPDPDVVRALSDFAAANRITAGVSRCFTDLSETRRHYEQAVKAAELGSRHSLSASGNACGNAAGGRDAASGTESLYLYQDHAFDDILEICSVAGDLMRFCDPRILRLLEYDKAESASLSETLYVFLRHECSTQAAANALYIHKNTLLYRMARIREIIRSDLSDPDDRFSFMLAFRILQYTGNLLPSHV